MAETMEARVQQDLVRVNALLTEELRDRSPIFDRMVRPLAEARGKQLRARLCLHWALSRPESSEIERLWLAGAIEFLHLATLIHDDVLDEAVLRRGVTTIHQKEGNKVAILSGDYLFAKAFYMIGQAGNLTYLQIFTKVIVALVEGEFLQMEDIGSLAQDVDRYLEKTEKKTAVLIEAACEVGARMAGYSEEEIAQVKTYGRALGMLFQITDDILDYTTSTAVAGKPIGNDLKEGVLTYPILSIKTDENTAFLEASLQEIQQGGPVEPLMEYVREQGGLTRTLALAETYAKEGRDALDALPDFAGKETLYAHLQMLMHRTK